MFHTRNGKVLIAVLVLLAAGAYFLTREPRVPSAPTAEVSSETAAPTLTREAALAALSGDISGGCVADGEAERYRSCEVEIDQDGDAAVVTVTHDGFFDDSVKASRIEAVMTYEAGVWTKTSVKETYQCWPNRGHQDFSSELCV